MGLFFFDIILTKSYFGAITLRPPTCQSLRSLGHLQRYSTSFEKQTPPSFPLCRRRVPSGTTAAEASSEVLNQLEARALVAVQGCAGA